MRSFFKSLKFWILLVFLTAVGMWLFTRLEVVLVANGDLWPDEILSKANTRTWVRFKGDENEALSPAVLKSQKFEARNFYGAGEVVTVRGSRHYYKHRLIDRQIPQGKKAVGIRINSCDLSFDTARSILDREFVLVGTAADGSSIRFEEVGGFGVSRPGPTTGIVGLLVTEKQNNELVDFQQRQAVQGSIRWNFSNVTELENGRWSELPSRSE
jgi:hypothetical protein